MIPETVLSEGFESFCNTNIHSLLFSVSEGLFVRTEGRTEIPQYQRFSD